MKPPKICLLLGLLIMANVHANELDTALKNASGQTETTVTATALELQTVHNALKATFNGATTNDWQRVTLEQSDHGTYITLQELATAQQGRGFFAINTHASKNRLLQAPHADSDLYTGKIVSRLFLEGDFTAAQWNTVKRDISDMAHTENTYWQAFTQAFAEQYPAGKIIQLHGYDQEVRKTEAGEASDMILSAGHTTPPHWVQQTAQCLKNNFPHRVSLYPFDVQELGGTTNVQGQLLQRLNHNGFLHIEMSKALRQQLLDDADLRKLLSDCL